MRTLLFSLLFQATLLLGQVVEYGRPYVDAGTGAHAYVSYAPLARMGLAYHDSISVVVEKVPTQFTSVSVSVKVKGSAPTVSLGAPVDKDKRSAAVSVQVPASAAPPKVKVTVRYVREQVLGKDK